MSGGVRQAFWAAPPCSTGPPPTGFPRAAVSPHRQRPGESADPSQSGSRRLLPKVRRAPSDTVQEPSWDIPAHAPPRDGRYGPRPCIVTKAAGVVACGHVGIPPHSSLTREGLIARGPSRRSGACPVAKGQVDVRGSRWTNPTERQWQT